MEITPNAFVYFKFTYLFMQYVKIVKKKKISTGKSELWIRTIQYYTNTYNIRYINTIPITIIIIIVVDVVMLMNQLTNIVFYL